MTLRVLLKGLVLAALVAKGAAAGPVARVLSERVLLQRGEPTLARMMDELAARYTPRCLWVVVGDARHWGDNWTHSHSYRHSHSHVILNLSGVQSQKAADYINENADELTRYSCVTYMMTALPAQEVLLTLADPMNKQMTRHFIVSASDSASAHRFLLDERLRNEEHLAAVVKGTAPRGGTAWNIFTRQLLHPSGAPEVQKANKWEEKKGLRFATALFPEQMANFYGARLQGVTLDFRPLVDYEEKPNSTTVIPKPSLDVFILNEIAKKLNFTYELKKPDDGLWGVQGKDGHWNGVVGAVEFRRANFSLVLSVTQERRLSVDFTRVYYSDPLSFVTAKSRPQPPWLKVITPFSDWVWLLTTTTVGFAVILYYLLFRVQGFLGSFRITPSRAFMHIFGSFLSQSLFTMPWLLAGQVFMGFWFIFAFLISSYYKTSLTAALAVPSVAPTIDTLTQLLNSDLRYGMIAQKGSEYQLFSTSNVSLYQQLFQRMTFYSSDESMALVAEGKYAYIYFKSNLETLVNTEYTSLTGETQLHIATEEFFPGGYGWAFPKGAPYRRTFDRVMWRCVQAGLISQWVKDLHAVYSKEAQAEKSQEERRRERAAALRERDDGLVVRLNHLTSVFMALIFGLASSTLVFIFEIAWTSSLPRYPEKPKSPVALPSDRGPTRSQAKRDIAETQGRTGLSGLSRRVVTATRGLVRSWSARTSSVSSEASNIRRQEASNIRRQEASNIRRQEASNIRRQEASNIRRQLIILTPLRGVSASEQEFRGVPSVDDFEGPGEPKPQESRPNNGLSKEASKKLE